MENEIEKLKRKLHEREVQEKKASVEECLIQVKDYANLPSALMNLDILYQKFIKLDQCARAALHPKKEQFSQALAIFLRNKAEGTPGLGKLVIQLLSTREEAALLEKERKFIKGQQCTSTGGDNEKQIKQEQKEGTHNPGSTPWQIITPWHASPQQWSQPTYPMSPYGAPPNFGYPPVYPAGRGVRGSRPRFPLRKTRCFSCNELGHLAKDCKK